MKKKKFSNPVTEVVVTYNRVIHSTTKTKPEDVHHEKDSSVIQRVYENLIRDKFSNLNKMNVGRKDQQADYNYLKNHKKFKLDNIYKKVNPSEIKEDHALINNKPIYKARFKKSKNNKI